MKYKKRIVTGAFALSLLVGGSSSLKTYADVGPKTDVHTSSSRGGALHFKNLKNARTKIHHKVGTITAIGATGFTFEVIHGHRATSKATATKILSIDVQTTASTTFKKDGNPVSYGDLDIGQKVIVSGSVDATGYLIQARQIDIVTASSSKPHKKNMRKE